MTIEEAMALALCEAWGNNPNDNVRTGTGTFLERERRVVAKILPALKERGFDLHQLASAHGDEWLVEGGQGDIRFKVAT